MGYIYAFVTCSRVKWDKDEEGNPSETPTEEHGWVDPRWSSTRLEENRNYVRPFVNCDEECAEQLADEVREALGWLEGGFEDNGDGTFYSADSYQPPTEPWTYSYALHFIRKSNGPEGWAEKAWHPVRDGGISL